MFCDVFYSSINKAREELCGDSVEVIRDHEYTIVVLADGLGSGVKANILSKMTAKIISALLKGGLSIEDAVSTMLKTLPVCKMRNLAYSTFSLVRIDQAGHAYILEFDSPAMIFMRDTKLAEVACSQRIIEGYKVKEAFVQLRLGDELYLISDGVVHAGIGSSLSLGWQHHNVAAYIEKMQREGDNSIFEKVLHVMDVCNTLYDGQPRDDSSVVGLEAKAQKQGIIMIGPPADKTRDGEVVSMLMQKDALKAVCGGTAANIVARETKARVKPRLEFPDPAVPPIAEMDGIDLVTEGVVTLSRTLDMLRQITANSPFSPNFSRRKDGASRLAKFLLKDCTHLKFLVGMTLNPAHKEFEFTNSMIKHRIVDEVVEQVKRLGKKVTVQFF